MTAPTESASQPAAKAPREALWKRRETILAVATVLLALAMGLARPDFLRPENLRDILINASIPAVAAAGMTAVIVAAQIDISIGPMLAIAAVMVAMQAGKGWPLPALVLLGIGTGAALGAVNGVLTAYLRIPSIVATLAMMGALRGVLVLVTGGDSIPVPNWLTEFGSREVLFLPPIVWAAILLCAAMALYLARTRPGRQHYAVGSNPRSAELSGVRVARVTLRSFVLLGALVGLGGFLFVTRYTPVYPTPLRGFELGVITAVVVGGTDIFGGRGTVLGTVLAAILLSTIDTSLTFASSFVTNLRSEVQPAIQGLLILAAVLYNSMGRRED